MRCTPEVSGGMEKQNATENKTPVGSSCRPAQPRRRPRPATACASHPLLARSPDDQHAREGGATRCDRHQDGSARGQQGRERHAAERRLSDDGLIGDEPVLSTTARATFARAVVSLSFSATTQAVFYFLNSKPSIKKSITLSTLDTTPAQNYNCICFNKIFPLLRCDRVDVSTGSYS